MASHGIQGGTRSRDIPERLKFARQRAGDDNRGAGVIHDCSNSRKKRPALIRSRLWAKREKNPRSRPDTIPLSAIKEEL
jgi:hypothetical protein